MRWFDLLAEKVKEGVEVWAMFDAFGNWSNNKPLKKRHLKKYANRESRLSSSTRSPFPTSIMRHTVITAK